MEKITSITLTGTPLPGNQILVSKKEFLTIKKQIKLLTDTVNILIEHVNGSEKDIQTLAQAIETLGGH